MNEEQHEMKSQLIVLDQKRIRLDGTHRKQEEEVGGIPCCSGGGLSFMCFFWYAFADQNAARQHETDAQGYDTPQHTHCEKCGLDKTPGGRKFCERERLCRRIKGNLGFRFFERVPGQY